MPTNNTQAVFDVTATTYDNDRFRLLPAAETFYRWALDLIPARAKNIVDLGGGSGLLTQVMRARFPNAQIHLIDFSASMLDLARARLAGDHNVTFHLADYVTGPWPERPCAVVSSLSIHHLDDDDKRTVFTRAFQSLLPGGTFVNADQIAGSTPALEQRQRALWLEQVRALGATEQQIADSLFRQQEDRCVPVHDQLNWMRDAGFDDAECWYKENRFAVLAGTR